MALSSAYYLVVVRERPRNSRALDFGFPIQCGIVFIDVSFFLFFLFHRLATNPVGNSSLGEGKWKCYLQVIMHEPKCVGADLQEQQGSSKRGVERITII